MLLFMFSKGMEPEDDFNLAQAMAQAIANSMITGEDEQNIRRVEANSMLTCEEEQNIRRAEANSMITGEEQRRQRCPCPLCMHPIEPVVHPAFASMTQTFLRMPDEVVDCKPQQHGARVAWLGGGGPDRLRRCRGEIVIGCQPTASIRGDWDTDEVWTELAEKAPQIVATDVGSTKLFLKETYQRLHRYAMNSETKHFVVELNQKNGRLMSHYDEVDVEDIFPPSTFGFEIVFDKGEEGRRLIPNLVATRGKRSAPFADLWNRAIEGRRDIGWNGLAAAPYYDYETQGFPVAWSYDDIVLDLKKCRSLREYSHF